MSEEIKHETTADQASARVVAVMGDIITIESTGDKPLVKNEVVYVPVSYTHLTLPTTSRV